MSARRPSPHHLPWGLRVLLVLSLVLACVPRHSMTTPEAIPAPPPSPPPAPGPPAPPPPAPEPPPLLGPVKIRVGLATDLETVELPCCEPRLVIRSGGEEWAVASKLRIAPADVVVRSSAYRLQVASLKDELQAQGIAAYLSEATGEVADVVFDADTDLYKVRYGRFGERGQADAERERLAGLGVMQGWVTSEGGGVENAGFKISGNGVERLVDGRWMEIVTPEEGGIPIHGGRYRGRMLLFLNDRGLLNLINELDVEDYLRGVVPKEMGPELYNQLEALKAQTVAARTYAVRNLGEFSNEGYDICSTPRCQVYGGMKVEHRLSDRAIAETTGQVVLYGGEPAETFYGATCGGHTENVEVVFPLKRGEYLKGVPCMETGPHRIAGGGHGGFPAAFTRRLLPPPADLTAQHQVLTARLERLAKLAGVAIPRDELQSLGGREIVRFLSSIFDLVIDARVFSPQLDETAPPPEWRPRDVRFATYVMESGLLADPADQSIDSQEVETLLFRLALYLGVLRHQEVHYLAFEKGELRVRTDDGPVSWTIPEDVTTLRRQSGSLVAGPLELAAGDRLELYWHHDRIWGLVQPLEAQVFSLKRHAPRQHWSFFMSQNRLREAVQTRYPGFPFEGFEVLSRGVSGRVGKLRLLGTDGRNVLVEGLAVRWTLDIPDTNFQARRQNDRNGWHFEGRGWGHGVGMCQAGAFGMAKRRLEYREILEHYYSGVELALMRQVRVRVRNHLGP